MTTLNLHPMNEFSTIGLIKNKKFYSYSKISEVISSQELKTNLYLPTKSSKKIKTDTRDNNTSTHNENHLLNNNDDNDNKKMLY